MTREQELEKMMKWIGYSLISITDECYYIEIEYASEGAVLRQTGETFEECVRKAMQQEGEL